MPIFLRYPVLIRSTRKLRSFLDFMLSEVQGSPSCFQYILDLFVITKIDESSTIALLFKVLSHAVNLRTLRFHYPELLLESADHWSTADIELPNLVRADFDVAGTKVVDWLKSRNSPISELSISAPHTNEPLDLIHAITNFSATLKKLEGDNVYIEPTAVQFIHLHTLRLHANEIIPAASVFRTFPNLRFLSAPSKPLSS